MARNVVPDDFAGASEGIPKIEFEAADIDAGLCGFVSRPAEFGNHFFVQVWGQVPDPIGGSEDARHFFDVVT